MAGQVVESMTDDFNPERYDDDYQEQLRELMEAKLEGGEAFTTEERSRRSSTRPRTSRICWPNSKPA